MEKIAVFAGSFDPFTLGHESIVERGLNIFDKIIIAIGYNSDKPGFLPLDHRKQMINDIFKDYPDVSVDNYNNLTVEFCKSKNARFLIRGLRTAVDFEYERAIGQSNKSLAPEIETVFILTGPEHTHINSSIVRDIIRHNGDASMFMSKKIDYRNYIK